MSYLENLNINRDYPTNPDNYTVDPGRSIEWIVLHYTGVLAPALNNVKYYQNPNLRASAHYFVGHATESGQIYQGVDPKHRAWHIAPITVFFNGACNDNSIGVEIACHNDTDDQSAMSTAWYFDGPTIGSVLKLVRALMADYNIPMDHVTTHYECTGKLCPAVWVHHPEQYDNFKNMLAVEPLPETPTPATDPPADEYYRVFVKPTAQKQIGAYKFENNAKSVLAQINSLSLEGFITHGK